MCLNPLTIPNKVINFHPHFDRLYNIVPCGHCAECLKNKRDDWYIRAYYQWLECKDNGGITLFVTLTYNNFWIPQIQLGNDVCNCFDKRDIQKFLDALRKVIKRKYKTDMPFCYLITSEYGGNTYRPHYHLLLFFTGKFNEMWLRYQIRRLWKYGFIKYGKENRGIISDYRGIRYVVKYITKDAFFTPISKRLKDSLPAETYKYYISRCAPFHLQSNGFGLCCKKYVSKYLLDKGTIPVPTKNGMVTLKMPLYLTRKYYYEYSKDLQKYYPTAEGVSVLSARSSKITERLAQSNLEFIDNVQTYLQKPILDWLEKYTSVTTNTDRIIRLFQDVKERFSDYIYYLQYERFYMYMQDGFPNPMMPNSCASYSEQYERKHEEGKNGIHPFYYSNSRFSTQAYDKQVRKECESLMYNELSENNLFEECAQITECLKKAYNQTKQEEDDKNEKVINQQKKLKEIYETSI